MYISRCFDKDGENIFLPWEQKGRFSAVAKEDNISGGWVYKCTEIHKLVMTNKVLYIV